MSRALTKKAVHIDPISGMICVDQIKICRKIVSPNGEIFLEFIDRDRHRSDCRGSCLVEIRLADLVETITIG